MLKLQKIYVILGPTASGKTVMSIKLAKKIGGEIISADSRQVYKGLDIGTGKVTKKEMAGIPHHLLDVASPKRQFTVAEYQKLALRKIDEIIARGKTPIIVGGTGFYIQAITENLVLPDVLPNPKLRTRLAKKTAAELFTILKKLDPARAKTIDAKNPVRLIRAIEIAKAIGKVPELTMDPRRILSSFAGGGDDRRKYVKIGLKIPQEELNKKIKKRLLARLKQGMVAEAKRLHNKGLSWKRMEQLGLEYRYLARFLQGKINKQEMIDQLYSAIVKYSKRQMTWFKRDKEIIWSKNQKEAFDVLKK